MAGVAPVSYCFVVGGLVVVALRGFACDLWLDGCCVFV